MTFHGTLFFQTVKFLGLRKTRLLFLLKQTSYEDIYHFLAATAGYVLSGVRRLRAPEQGDFVLWWGRVGWSTKYYSFLLEYCPHSGVIHPEKKWPAWSTKYCYFNWSTNLSAWQGVHSHDKMSGNLVHLTDLCNPNFSNKTSDFQHKEYSVKPASCGIHW